MSSVAVLGTGRPGIFSCHVRGGRTSISKKKSLRGFLLFLISVCGELAYWRPLQAAAVTAVLVPCAVGVRGGKRFIRPGGGGGGGGEKTLPWRPGCWNPHCFIKAGTKPFHQEPGDGQVKRSVSFLLNRVI